jgi:hypothetical protein
MSDKASLTLVAQPQAYFRELVSDAMTRQKVTVQPETEFYLVNLLNQFMISDRLYARDASGGAREEPLALMLKEALEAPAPTAQAALFRHVGDVSLYMAGFFQESLNRKLVDLDYYIEMGGAAYKSVAIRVEESKRDLYRDLAAQFGRCVDILADVSDRTAQRSGQDLLRIYEVWLQTRSGRAAKALQEAGIFPNEGVKKEWQ